MGKITQARNIKNISLIFLIFFGTYLLASNKTAAPTITVDSKQNVSCAENSDGSISISVSGGGTSPSYSWTGPNGYTSINEDINNLSKGTYTVTFTDDSGNPVSKSVTLTVEDTSPPSVITKNITINLDASGNASIAEDAVDNGSSDSCAGTLSFDTDITSFNCSDVGDNTVTLTVTDVNGNSATKSATVTVKDVTAPTVVTKNITVQLDASGNATIAEDAVNNGSSDACGGLTYDTDITSFDCSDVGANTVTLTVTDANNNSATKTATVTVEDNTAPTVVTKNITVQLDTSGNATIAEDAVNNGSSDACGGLTYDTDITSFDCSNVGANTVTLTVTDANNNSATKTATVTVEDNTAPTVVTKNITVQLDASGNATIAEDAVNNGSSDACGGLTYDTDITSFDCSDVGANTVTLTVTDANNNSATKTAIVTVEDNTAPTVITKNITVQLDASGNANIAEDAVNNGSSDACGGLTYDTDITSFDCSNVGANTVNLTVTDANNNSATKTATVTVEDNTAPTVITKNITVQLDASGNATIAEDAVNDGSSDACGGLTYDTDITSFDCSNVGANTVNLTVTDANNNSATKTATVTVEDNIDPVITAGANISVNNDPGNCGAMVSIPAATATDNCSVNTPTGTRSDGMALSDEYPLGTTTITWTTTDANGNDAASVEQTVTVTDNEAPEAPVIEDILWGCERTITAPIANDNCSGEITGTTSSPLTYSSAGTYNITWTFDDGNGNTSTATQKVTIDPVESEAIVTNILCHGNATGEIEIIASGGVAPYTYTWNSIGTGNIKTGLIAGTYTVTVSDANGCQTNPLEVTVTEPEALAMTEPVTEPVSCYGSENGSVTAGDVTGGTGSYKYKITGKNYQTSSSFTNLAPGNYTFTVQDENSCTYETDFTITEPSELQMGPPSSTPTTCYGGNDGTITAGEVSGGNGDYQYSIDNTNFSSETNFTGLSAGTYTIFVKDAKDCALQKTINVEEPDELSAEIVAKNVNCYEGNDGLISISNPTGGSGSYEFSIDNSTWYSSTDEITGLVKGSYPVYIRDTNTTGCIVTLNEAVQISQPAEPLSAEITTTRTTSYGSATGSATANPTGGTPGYTYEWRKEGGTSIITSTKTANNLYAGNYEVTVKDANGCFYTEDVKIIDALEAVVASRSVCEDEGNQDAIRTSFFEVTDHTAIGGIPPYSYSWNFGSSATNPTRSGPGEHAVYFTSTGNKTINLVVTDSIGKTFTVTQQVYVGNCYEPCGKSENFVFDPDNIYIGDVDGNPVNTLDLVNCNNTIDKYIFIKVDKSANAYNPYVELIYKISNTISGASTVSYAGGCRDGDDIDDDPNDNKDNKIGEFIKLTLDPIDYTCGDNLDVENFYVTWTNVSSKKCGQNNNAFCYSTNEPVVVPTPLSAEATASPIMCKGDNSGVITTQVSGGYAPYSYNLTGPNDSYSNSNKFNNLTAGDYTVYVRDSRGNTTTASVTITQPDSSVAAEVSSTSPVCYGGTGEATVSASGGTPFESGDPYHYLWNDASEQTTATATGLTAGEYTVTVIDANGCQTIQTVTITEPEQLSVADAGEDQSFGCGLSSTSLEANTPETGVGEWSTVSGPDEGAFSDKADPNSEFSGSAGTYVLRWTISHSDGTCATTSDVSITFKDDCSTLDFDGVDDYIDFGDNYGLTSGSFSLEAWVKLKSLTGVKTVLSKRNAANFGDGGFDLIVNNGAPTFRWGNNSVSTSSKLNTDRWYHLAVIYKSSKVKLYVDGIQVGSSSATNPTGLTNSFLIGAMYNTETPEFPKNFFHGWIEEVRIWNTALTEEQLHFMMNQRLEANGSVAKGTVLPLDVPDNLSWSQLVGYYRLIATDVAGGVTKDLASVAVDGILRNIETTQENTAPLPYYSVQNGSWRTDATWARPSVWDPPNSKGINGSYIDWNIAKISNNITSGSNDITLLGLISEKNELSMAKDGEAMDEHNSGQGLSISHYLKLDGSIDLIGESQLVQYEGSILDESSSGIIERDQQGTKNSYNYNYWSSPVSLKGSANNSGYKIHNVLWDGTNSSSPVKPSFDYPYTYADGNYSGPKHISTYWLYTFHGTANTYGEWHYIGDYGHLDAGEGYTMKGTSGSAPISSLQNYVFIGKPNNGTIKLNISKNQNRLVGNPYPSAIDAEQFIRDNLKDVQGGTNSQNVFNGSVYFWDHFGQEDSHVLRDYVGGYAAFNLSGGVPAASTDYRINATGEKGTKIPRKYIPVAQGFFVNTVIDESLISNINVSGGDILFKNGQRAFVRESSGSSQFLMAENRSKNKTKQAKYSEDTRYKIRLYFHSPGGFNRQILVTADSKTTDGFDLGYDAPLMDDNNEDMFWMIDDAKFVIQAVPNFNVNQVLPLGVKLDKEGKFEIKIDSTENLPSNIDLYLRDSKDTTYFDLRKAAYKAEASKGYYPNRYALVFQDQSKIADEDQANEKFKITYSIKHREISLGNPDLYKIKKVVLYNINGKQVDSFEDVPLEKTTYLDREKPLSSGVYIIKVYTDTEVYARKVIIDK